jgi:hypothetical protein
VKISKFAKCMVGLILVFLCLVGCGSVPSLDEQPTVARATATLQIRQDDNATSGAAQRNTRQALNAQATLVRKATEFAGATETAQAQNYATATVVARVTGEAVFAAKSAWPKAISESFANNTLGWPLGVTTDRSPVVTAKIAGGRYQWSVVVPHGNSYINLMPKNGPAFSAFYASVTVLFESGESGDQTSYGLVFRNVGKDYGFFGISQSGDFRILDVEDGGIASLDQEGTELINTQPGQVNRIAVVAIGPDFVFLINDQVVGQMNAELAPGQIGLGVDALSSAGETQVSFSDFEIAAPQ